VTPVRHEHGQQDGSAQEEIGEHLRTFSIATTRKKACASNWMNRRRSPGNRQQAGRRHGDLLERVEAALGA
jgi:hypothetical protein